MNAKDRANFINSVQTDTIEKLICSACGAEITAGDKFCDNCGAEVVINNRELMEEKAPLNRVREPAVKAAEKVKSKIADTQRKTYVEPINIFALGLPEWSIEPPQVVVRRKRKI
ncbi:zinc ribbon domain-containing protein [Clostridium sp. YIM B02515]|uniref:Zinc ribbon domain-containing protein n=1 Tax=Clostridium rhizosphaerae TaxID=2803861 RepID=A0ABS1T8G3_9CLOT|nr:zinc ribbon domain-containing protein [Clostridium rhizosphaerae]MBL4935561.1 zinc ribbon domain-containing protein [Clostridium rhizosphaerae]